MKQLANIKKQVMGDGMKQEVRRAEKMAEEDSSLSKGPVETMEQLHRQGAGLLREEAEGYLTQLDRDRREWRQTT